MAQITANLVKELRERTNAGMMDCKKALVESDGDMDKAIDWLREKGLSQAAKKAGRIAAEGVVYGLTNDDNTVGVIVEVNCETDFVAKTDNFVNFAKNVAKHIAVKNPADVDTMMAQPFCDDEAHTISDLVSEATVAIGEKISVRRFARYESTGIVDTYIHLGGKVGVIVELTADVKNDAVKTAARDVALQICAAKPEAVRRDEVDAEKLNKEKEVLRAQALNEGKPEKIVERMVEGRISKYYKEVCLLEQPFVKNGDVDVQGMLNEVGKANGTKLDVVRFTRLERGEGMEKRVNDLAAEIAEQTAAMMKK